MGSQLRSPTWGVASAGTAGLGVILGTSRSRSVFGRVAGRAGKRALPTIMPEERILELWRNTQKGRRP